MFPCGSTRYILPSYEHILGERRPRDSATSSMQQAKFADPQRWLRPEPQKTDQTSARRLAP